MKYTKIICLVLIALLLLVACAEPQDDPSDTTPSEAGADTTPSQSGDTSDDSTAYAFPDVSYNNETFRIFNAKQTYSMIMNVTASDFTGDKVNDAIYNNILDVEDKFKINIEETLNPFGSELLTIIQTELMSGTQTHDVAYLYSTQVGTLIGSGSLTNLYDNEAINIDSAWWNQSLKKDATLYGDNLYYLVSDAHLMSFEGTWCIYFNEDMMKDLGLELPYDAVRSNKWTLDTLYDYAAQGASLNSDASFSWSSDGSSVYGLASFKNLMNAFVTGCDLMYVRKDANDTPYYSFPSETSLYEKLEAIARITGESGTYISANERSAGFHYIEHIFARGRSLLIGAEIKAAATELNDIDFKFGIAPMPKYSSEQESYKSNMLWSTLLLTIPAHVQDTERSGVIMDALSYYSMINTMPEYYDRVSYRGLADENAIEMLGIVSESRYLNWGLTYGWLSSIEPNVNAQLNTGNASLSSLVKASSKVVPALIDKTLASISK